MPQPKVIAVRVANLFDKDFLLALDPVKFFTEPHYDEFPAVEWPRLDGAREVWRRLTGVMGGHALAFPRETEAGSLA